MLFVCHGQKYYICIGLKIPLFFFYENIKDMIIGWKPQNMTLHTDTKHGFQQGKDMLTKERLLNCTMYFSIILL